MRNPAQKKARNNIVSARLTISQITQFYSAKDFGSHVNGIRIAAQDVIVHNSTHKTTNKEERKVRQPKSLRLARGLAVKNVTRNVRANLNVGSRDILVTFRDVYTFDVRRKQQSYTFYYQYIPASFAYKLKIV